MSGAMPVLVLVLVAVVVVEGSRVGLSTPMYWDRVRATYRV